MRSALALAVLALAGCAGGGGNYTAELVVLDGMPSITGGTFFWAFERGDSSMWITPTQTFEGDLAWWRLDQGETTAFPMAFDGGLPAESSPWSIPLITGPHARSATMVDRAGRLWIHDEDTNAFVDRGPVPSNFEIPNRPHLIESPSGRILWVQGGVRILEADGSAWTTLVEPEVFDLRAATIWEDRLIVLTRDAVAELADDGTVTTLATCEAECDDRWGVFHHPANGELWIQWNWVWWSFDGESIRSVGPMPNTDSTYITQVGSTVVDGNRVLTANRVDYSTTEHHILSWRPETERVRDHDLILDTAVLVGSDESSILGVPIGLAYGLGVLH